jgi:hypothetical protein
LWTGGPTDTWAVVVAGDGVFYRDHWDGSSWTRTLGQDAQEGRFQERPVWSTPSRQAFGGSSASLQRWLGKLWFEWRPTPSCHAIGGTAENDVWCASDNDLQHFDGRQWTHEPLVGIHGILALARDDVWIWGAAGALHFDGLGWTAQLSNLVRSLSASGPRDVWAVRDGNLWHSAGANTTWAQQNPSGSQISGVWSQSLTNTWIVAAGAAMRWDGATWTTATLPGADELLLISGSSQDVWIAGTAMLFHGRAGG